MMRSSLEFLLEWLDIGALFSRPRFAGHSWDTVRAVLDTCERIAAEKFAPVCRRSDTEEPRLVGDQVVLPQCAYDTAHAYVESGMLAASQDIEVGGMQLPYMVEVAANVMFCKAGVSLGGGSPLTVGNANLLLAHGTALQKRVFAQKELAGRWFGTMCLSEPQAGSSLADILTRALPDGAGCDADPLGARYRLFGSKTWITNGDHEITENIVHLVLAKIPDASGELPPGTRGISLFIVPKRLVDEQGRLTDERNDVATAGLNHKLGSRGLPNALLSFGEGRYPVRGGAGAIGYRVGRPGEGLQCMFHMMNEARLAVGLGAAALAYAGFESSLAYARERRQGRPTGATGKDTASAQIRIVEHPDVRRMLLAQKAYAEGGLALTLYCARLLDEARTGSELEAREARMLLDLLTPAAKSWPSQWGVEANSLAIQVLGGCGYTRDFPVEQYWRDNRLNMIHEGTHGIQALDLLGRKVRMDGGAAFELLADRVSDTVARSVGQPGLRAHGQQLEQAFRRLHQAAELAWGGGNAQDALANATPFLEAFGHVVIAWLWLDAVVAAARVDRGEGDPGEKWCGKLQAMQYFYAYELPKIDAWLQVVAARDRTCLEMRDEWFER